MVRSAASYTHTHTHRLVPTYLPMHAVGASQAVPGPGYSYSSCSSTRPKEACCRARQVKTPAMYWAAGPARPAVLRHGATWECATWRGRLSRLGLATQPQPRPPAAAAAVHRATPLPWPCCPACRGTWRRGSGAVVRCGVVRCGAARQSGQGWAVRTRKLGRTGDNVVAPSQVLARERAWL